ncbi:unnamed protein product [Nezara viridula]|uniref:Uncharacterized protein n=1 Tax=Nezara viridula TaxID=85310 RepID=A0A9P0EAL1_NEZVI|nr:unnamed protein product [Nezara viridula]
MNVERLFKEELEYELKIRGITGINTVDEMRKKLRTILKLETTGKYVPPVVELPSASELLVCEEKLTIIGKKIFSISPTSSADEIDKIDTGLLHLINRLNQITTTDATEIGKKSEAVPKCLGLFEEFVKKLENQNKNVKEQNPEDSQQRNIAKGINDESAENIQRLTKAVHEDVGIMMIDYAKK